MPRPTTRVLTVPGARLYCEVRGSGPALLMVPTGNGDAAPLAALADLLAEHRTVITYDRRGFSRSPLDGPVDDERRLLDDVQDAVYLIDVLAHGRADVFGTCSGGIVALVLLERHPRRVRRMVVHEPPLASVLPDAAQWSKFHADLYDLYRESGAGTAKEAFKNHLGLAETRPPKDAELPADQLAELLARLGPNLVFWFEHEMRSYPETVLDLAALGRAADRLVLAVGTTSRGQFPYLPNTVLAEHFGTDVVEFPGGHLGSVTHPRAFADLLARLL